MTVIELHRDFSERYPYARPSKKTTGILCGQIDNITLDAAWTQNPDRFFFLWKYFYI